MAFSTDHLQDLTDDQIRELITAAGELLRQRHEAARQKAIEEARARLAEVGLTFRDVGGAPPRAARHAKLRRGDRYVNPLDPTQAHIVGRGRPPKWFTDMEAKGSLPAPTKGDGARKGV